MTNTKSSEIVCSSLQPSVPMSKYYIVANKHEFHLAKYEKDVVSNTQVIIAQVSPHMKYVNKY
jgi:hypothetical protein